MPNRSKGRDQTKCDPLVLQAGGWVQTVNPPLLKLDNQFSIYMVLVAGPHSNRLTPLDITRKESTNLTMVDDARELSEFQ